MPTIDYLLSETHMNIDDVVAAIYVRKACGACRYCRDRCLEYAAEIGPIALVGRDRAFRRRGGARRPPTKVFDFAGRCILLHGFMLRPERRRAPHLCGAARAEQAHHMPDRRMASA